MNNFREFFKNNAGFIFALYIFSNLGYTTFHGFSIKTYNQNLNIILKNPREINLGDLNDKLKPFFYSWKLTNNSQFEFRNGDKFEFDSSINLLENCLCFQTCYKKKQIKSQNILNYYNSSEDKIYSQISNEKFENLLLKYVGSSICDLNPQKKRNLNGGLFSLIENYFLN